MTELFVKNMKNLLIFNSRLKNTNCVYSTVQKYVESNLSNSETLSQRVLKVAIIGMPNGGKSTFINHLMDRKVCPTSSKVHTTRKKSRAIFTENNSQIIFLDTPGLVADKTRKSYDLEKSFVNDCQMCLQEADTIGVVHDVSNIWTRETLDIKVIRSLKGFQKTPSFLVLNKIDVLKSKRKLLELTRLITNNQLDGKPILNKQFKNTKDHEGWPYFKEIFMVSALTGDGMNKVRAYLINKAKPNEWLYPEEVWSDQTPENIISDTVKAALLDFLPQEIPYLMKPQMEFYEVQQDGSITTTILVKCTSERIAKLVAGVGNGRLKQITEKTQKDLENVFQQRVNLQIILKSKKEK